MSKPAVSGTKSSTNNKVIEELRHELEEVVLEPDLWLKTPHAMLGGKEPIELALSGKEGKEIVLNLIRLIRSGSFS
jgi:hypothetical protein